MLTHRGWWFFLATLALTAVGLAATAGTVTLIAFTLLAWFLGNWLVFAVRIWQVQATVSVQREVTDGHGPLKTLWARMPARVRVSLHCGGWASFPFVSMIDRVPVLVARREGDFFADGALAHDHPLETSYRIECPAPGRLRFEGVQARFADLHGFFTHQAFIRRVEIYRVLPPLADMRGHIPGVKRFNLIPLMGHHPHRRPGSGSDLLDLRDYLPGDPPKTIAWKASARRGRLMTKEFESEVPVRCTLFLDTSNSVRVGTVGKNALARLVEIAAAVMRGNAAAHDLTGLCLFDEDGVGQFVRPARGARHVVQLTNLLADAADLSPWLDTVPLARLLPLAYAALQDFHPAWLVGEINASPWRLFFPSQYRWRKKVAAVLSVHFGLGPGGLGLLLEDDEQCVHFVQRFLAEHQIPCPLPYYDAQGRYLFGAPGKIDVLATALLHAVFRGRDNELFVLVVDFLESGPRLEKIVRAVRVALGRHHQVIVLCPWPPGVDLLPGRLTTLLQKTIDAGPSLQELLAQSSTLRIRQAYIKVRQAFTRLGVPVICARDEESAHVILQRMQRLRSWQRGLR